MNEAYLLFDVYKILKIRVIFVEISGIFDEDWHYKSIYKHKTPRIFGLFLLLVESFVKNRFQRFWFNPHTFDWLPVDAGRSERSILGPLFFLI